MSELDNLNSDSEIDSHANGITLDSDSDVEVISESYFNINTVDSVNKKNIALRKKVIKYKTINETLRENLSIGKNTVFEMNKMITELTSHLNSIKKENIELKDKLTNLENANKVLSHDNIVLSQNIQKLDEQVEELACEKKYLEIQVNDLKKSQTYWVRNNWFLTKTLGFFFALTCSGIIYTYKQFSKSNNI